MQDSGVKVRGGSAGSVHMLHTHTHTHTPSLPPSQLMCHTNWHSLPLRLAGVRPHHRPEVVLEQLACLNVTVLQWGKAAAPSPWLFRFWMRILSGWAMVPPVTLKGRGVVRRRRARADGG